MSSSDPEDPDKSNEDMTRLMKESSWGTPGTELLRSRTNPRVTAAIRARAYFAGSEAGRTWWQENKNNSGALREKALEVASGGEFETSELLILLAAYQSSVAHEDEVLPNATSDPLAQTKRAAGFQVIKQALNDHLDRITSIRAKYPVEDSDLLSSNITHATDVPEQVRAEVRALHSRIRQIIGGIAFAIENDKYRDIEESIKSLPARSMRERAASLVKADKDLHISYETLRLTISFFSDLNSEVLSRIEHEPSVERQAQMMFGNAILIYELTDYVSFRV